MEGMRDSVFLMVCFMGVIATLMPMATGIIDQSPDEVANWFNKVGYKEEKKTNLHFYFHDQISGKSPTAVLVVAPANMTVPSQTGFGFIVMVDDPLTVGPERYSTEVDRIQGMHTSADLKEFVLHMTMNFVFTSGEYNGSTLSLLAQNPTSHKYREMPIVGGTGAFRLARGVATAKTYCHNDTSLDTIVECHIIVLHY